MSESPQNDETINEEVNEVVEINDSVSPSESEEQVPVESEVQVDEVEAAKQKANEAFNKQYGEKKQLERELEAQRAKNAEFEQAERERQAAQVGNIPPLPDAFDEDYEQKLQAHIDAKAEKKLYEERNNSYLQQQQFNQQQAAQAKQDEINKKITSYSEKAKNLGVDPSSLQSAATTLQQMGISLQTTPDLVLSFLDDEDGPLITQYLAGNAQDAYSLLDMNSVQQAQFIERTVRGKAGALKPKTSNAPKPATNLQGNGVAPDDGYKHIKGAKFY